MRLAAVLLQLGLAFSLAACSGSDLSVGLPGERGRVEGPLQLEFPPGRAVEHRLPFRISGGIPPYQSSVEDCPDWVTLFPDQGILTGTAPVADSDSTFFCTYSVTESDPGFRSAQTVAYGLRLVVGPHTIPPLMLPASVVPGNEVSLSVGTFRDVPFLPATDGVQPYTYSFTCAGGSLPSGISFAPATRRLAGTPRVRFQDSCTYSVTDSAQPAATVSVAVEVVVAGPVTGTLMLPASVVPGNVIRLRVGERARVTFRPVTGGVEPYTYGLHCSRRDPDTNPGPIIPPGTLVPSNLGFGHLTRVLSGTPSAPYSGPDCTYWVTDSADPAATLARSVALIVEPERAKWQFPASDRSLTQRDVRLNRAAMGAQTIITLPAAEGAPIQNDATPVYRISDALGQRLSFSPLTRALSYTHPESNSLPSPLGMTATYRYQVLFGDTVDDTLCIDVSFRKGADADEDPDNDPLFASVRIRDDAFWDGTRHVCPDPPLQPASASHAAQSNPVHEALGPVHARRALDVALGAVRASVRAWTPGASRVLTAIAPQVGIGSLSGESAGFDYTGSSESLSTGAEIGAGSWQAGLVGAYTRTELHYRATAGLAERGYRSGEHITGILSLHPFAAWHMPSGGRVWASLGAGTGQLRHRDDLGFPSWSRSDVRLLTHSLGAALPIADVLSGVLEAEAGIESFAFEIEGGDHISSALPTMRGRDYRAGLAWSAPIAGAPSLSVAYKRLTGNGPEGGQLEARGSVSVEGLFDPRLTVIGNAQGSFGLGDHEHDSWSLGGGVRFAPGEGGRGFALNLDARLASPDAEEASGAGIRGEAGYGLWGGPSVGPVRPYVGLIRRPGDGSLRRALGVDLRNTPASRINIEIHDQPRDRLRALEFTLRHRF